MLLFYQATDFSSTNGMIVDLIQSARQGEWAQVRQLLLKHWLVQVPEVFEVNSDLPWDNTAANERILGGFF